MTTTDTPPGPQESALRASESRPAAECGTCDVDEVCPLCGGEGELLCPYCNGSGQALPDRGGCFPCMATGVMPCECVTEEIE